MLGTPGWAASLPASLPLGSSSDSSLLFPQLPVPAWNQTRVPSPSLVLLRASDSGPRGPGGPGKRPCVPCAREPAPGPWRGYRDPKCQYWGQEGTDGLGGSPSRRGSAPGNGPATWGGPGSGPAPRPGPRENVMGSGRRRRSRGRGRSNRSMAMPLQPAQTPVSHLYLGGWAEWRIRPPASYLRGRGAHRSDLNKSQGLHVLVHLPVCHQASLVRKTVLCLSRDGSAVPPALSCQGMRDVSWDKGLWEHQGGSLGGLPG